MERIECVVIGAGVVGLAIARKLSHAGREVLVLEAKDAIGTGTSSRNSEVIHAGIYYPHESLKSRLCVEGRNLLYRYCAEHGIEHRKLTKIIVATSDEQTHQLGKYEAQAIKNGVDDLIMLDSQQVTALEPQVRCVAGLLSPSSGIIDSHGLMAAYRADIESANGLLAFNSPVVGGALTKEGILLEVDGTPKVELRCQMVVNAAGLGAQDVSRAISGVDPQGIPRRYLCKGSYFSLHGTSPFSRLVYPIANSAGLGVHVTLDLAGRTRFGPDVEWTDELDYEVDPDRAPAFAEAIRGFFPGIDASKLQPAYAGIRPKISPPGHPPADFCIRGPADHGGARFLALYGIESPGLTASLALADHVSTMMTN